MAMKKAEYEPEPRTLEETRPTDVALDQALVSKSTVERIAEALRASAFEFDQSDHVTIVSAEELKVVDEDEYRRGYDLLAELGALEERITKHYVRFDKPLSYLTNVVRGLRNPQLKMVTPIKQALSKRLGTWRFEQEARAKAEARKRQEAADAAAKAAQLAKAAELERVAAQETNAKLAESFRREAEVVRAADVRAAPVEAAPIPTVDGGYTRTTWKCEFLDINELLKAHVEGRCHLDTDAIAAGLQSSMDKHASDLTVNMGKAFPGTRAVPNPIGVARRR